MTASISKYKGSPPRPESNPAPRLANEIPTMKGSQVVCQRDRLDRFPLGERVFQSKDGLLRLLRSQRRGVSLGGCAHQET